jgi:hypothetical protein
LGVPSLALAFQLGWLKEGRAGERAATWIVRVFGVMLPMLLALMLLLAMLKELGVSDHLRVVAALATALGTSIFPYAISFVGHALSGAALLSAIYLLHRAGHSARHWLYSIVGGLAAAGAVLFEYHSVVGTLCIAAWLVIDRDLRRVIPGFVLGALIAFGIHSAIHIPMFGSPFRTGHHFLSTAHNLSVQGHGFLGISGFHPKALLSFLFDPYLGFLALMPWLLVGSIAGIVYALRGKLSAGNLSTQRCAAAVVIVYLLFVCTLEEWRAMNGWSIGPRFLTPAMLPMALLAGVGWQHLHSKGTLIRGIGAGLAVASILIVGALTISFASPPNVFRNPFAEMALPLLLDGFAVHNLGSMLGLGAWSLLALAVGFALAVALIIRNAANGSRAIGIIALVVAGVWLLGLSQYKPTSPDLRDRTLDFVRQVSEGVTPDD